MNKNTAPATPLTIAPRESGATPTSPTEDRWEGALEKIEAVIREDRLEPVLHAIGRLGYEGVTVTRVHGRGRERQTRLQWRGMKCNPVLLPRVRIELIIHQPDTDSVIDAIVAHARTGAIGDGKIWVTPVTKLVRVRTGELGATAV